MSTKPATPRWQLTWIGSGVYHAYRLMQITEEENTVQSLEIEAHCKWCAKLELVKEHGGTVDLRGATGECAQKLKDHLANTG